jgi:hypothetical protein
MQYFEIAFYDPFGKKTNNDLYINQFGKVIKFSFEKGPEEMEGYTYEIIKRKFDKRKFIDEIIAIGPEDFNKYYFIQKEKKR